VQESLPAPLAQLPLPLLFRGFVVLLHGFGGHVISRTTENKTISYPSTMMML
jgi:hypothetical protein